MPDVSWNIDSWQSDYGWDGRGEEWSAAWGSSVAQWIAAIYPRIHRFIPCRSILEIATGFGRWTRFLIPAAQEAYCGIDLAEKCISHCRELFAPCGRARFFVNDGRDLSAAADRQYDLVFSFDSLVHADRSVMEIYLPQILRILSYEGVAFIHHSNLASIFEIEGLNDRSMPLERRHFRDSSVSADIVRAIVEHNGGSCLIQELVNWGGERLIDCFTLFCSADSYRHWHYLRIENSQFMAEASGIRDHINPYCHRKS